MMKTSYATIASFTKRWAQACGRMLSAWQARELATMQKKKERKRAKEKNPQPAKPVTIDTTRLRLTIKGIAPDPGTAV